ncbi:hypothetical protein NLX83_40165 [Allokutzneria sp. A3M-2-11 16]|uniref:glycosyl hydrolase family 95 catalytic domain-containing protein n=1 Tax=Allokutzneria sp. A3M-2-11 16 TaxID=2962043 RepID=UPI0020B7E5C4|nr:hypothetical protein [Allokutzneria sp. A3M-2-11 16]MCP3805499.1 hypothetical protein [Allokutzneria sp. A3M-2-11 16]
MTALSRRTFLGASAALAVVASPVAWAASETGTGGGTHERTAADAAMRWRRLPDSWQNGPFLGNGFLGAQLYRAEADNVLKVMLSHGHVQDQRVQWEAGIGLSRLPIGFLTLTTAGAITAVDWRLDLWNAELTGTITTTRGGLTFTALVHNDRDVLLVSLTTTAGEESAAWGFTPLPSHTTRKIRVPADYTGNPDPTIGVGFVEQTMHAGGGYTTAWQEKRAGTRRLLVATIAYGYPNSTGREEALRTVRRTLAESPDALVAVHRRWWNRYYRKSFVSVPDKLVQRFYWIQLYKMAAATRENAPVLAEWGPWFPEVGNSWTAVWWNLNVQVAYPMVNGSNHPELDAVTPTFRRYHRNLEQSVPPAYRDGDTYALSHPGDRTLRPGGTRSVGIPGTGTKTDQTGNLIWGLHNVWLAYRHSMDERVLRDVLFPILAKAVNFYRHFLVQGSDGYLHLPLTRSPEYADAADCTYDLSLIRWGCGMLIDTAHRLRINDPRLPVWRDVLAKLVPYHRTAQGVIIGDGVPLAESHRHFSHLLWLYPLREYQWDRPADRALMRTSYDHWSSLRVNWHGYSFAAASTMCSLMDSPEEALANLLGFLDGSIVHETQLTPNTMYREGTNLAIESPLTAAQSVLDMLVQSGDGVVKVFPSVSKTWPDASVESLRTQGTFLVDASRRNGSTEWVRVHSEAGEPLVLQHGVPGEIDVRDSHGRPVPWRQVAPNRISVRLRRGESALITRRGTRPTLAPRDVPSPTTPPPPWGLP